MELSCQKALRCLGVFCVKVPSDSLTPPCHAKLPGSASLSRDVQDAPHPAHWGSHYPALLQWLPAPRQFPAWLGSPGNPAPSPIPHLPQPGRCREAPARSGGHPRPQHIPHQLPNWSLCLPGTSGWVYRSCVTSLVS